MDVFTDAATARLERASTTDEYVELILASQLLSSEKLYQQALKALAGQWMVITLKQAQKIGMKAYYELTWRYRTICSACDKVDDSVLYCDSCNKTR
jgi:hypothetical protein